MLTGQGFWQDGKKTFDSGTTRLPATDLGIYADLTLGCAFFLLIAIASQ